LKIKDNIILRSDIPEYLTNRGIILKRVGREYRCACPVHGGTRSDSFCCTGKKWYCFGCCEGGSIIELHMLLNGVSFLQTIYDLANMYDISIDDNEEYQQAKSYFEQEEQLINKFEKNIDKGYAYLHDKRKLSDETIKALRYGFNDEHGSIVIPIRNSDGMLVARAERNFRDGMAKYVNDRNNEYYAKGETLYNFDRAKRIMRKQGKVYMCEGYFDVASAEDQGLPCVGYTGANITQAHIKMLAKELTEYDKKFVVLFAPDNDEEGQKRIPQIRDKFKEWGPQLNVRVVKFPDGYKDFSDLHQAGLSISDLETEHIDVFCCMKGVESCPDKETEYQYALAYLPTVSNKLIRSEIAEKLAVRWGKKSTDIIDIANGDKTETSLVQDFKQPLQAVQEFRELISTGTIGTGFADIDTSIENLRKSEVVVIAAYASTGKTFAGINMALNAAFREKKNVIFFSMEMSAATLICRLIAMFMKKTEKEVEELLTKGDELALMVEKALNKKLLIVDQNSLTIKDIRKYINVANTMVFEGTTDMIIVDYLQYMPNTNTYEGMSETVRGFKPLAKELNIVPVILSQLNREGSPWQKPEMTQMKGGGDIEATADWILGMWRDSANPALSIEEQEVCKDKVNISILKGRRVCGQRDFQYLLKPEETYFYPV
jgi:KaiC/GvpD/RAD55 family RecA-like ATPase